MAIEVLLLNNIKDLGKVGEIVQVKNGYARNFLFPQGLATQVTKAALRQIEARKAKIIQEYEDAIAAAQATAEKIGKVVVTLAVQAGDDGRLFGSITTSQIQEALAKEGFNYNRRLIDMGESIRTLGDHPIKVEIHPEVKATFTVKTVHI
jgi:large subunit ribosomal protein L9